MGDSIDKYTYYGLNEKLALLTSNSMYQGSTLTFSGTGPADQLL